MNAHAPANGPTILVVEDDEPTRDEIARNLAAHGYRLDVTGDARSALERWEARRPDLVLLDLGLPDLDGLAVIRRIRREATTPIVVVSGRGEEASKVDALELGADDYLAKPFGMAELHARLRAVMRRTMGPAADPTGIVHNGDLVLDPLAHTVTVRGEPVALTPREFEILRVLLAHPGRLVTRGRLLRAVWGEAYAGEGHYIHVHISQLRRKLAQADDSKMLDDLFVAEPGVGYRVRQD